MGKILQMRSMVVCGLCGQKQEIFFYQYEQFRSSFTKQPHFSYQSTNLSLKASYQLNQRPSIHRQSAPAFFIIFEAVKFEETRMQLMLTLLAVIQSAAFFPAAAAQTPTLPTHTSPTPLPTLPKPLPITWEQFCLQYGKHYASLAEQHYRKHIFLHAVRQMQQHNANPNRTYSMKINPLFDVDALEFQEVYTRPYYQHSDTSSGLPHQGKGYARFREKGGKNDRDKGGRNDSGDWQNGREDSDDSINSCQPDKDSTIGRMLSSTPCKTNSRPNIQIDWSMISGKVRFQGTCGGCYAFTAVDTFAASYSKQMGFFVSFSIQQVIECADNGLTFGCKGGYLQGAYAYLQTHGVLLEKMYPYTLEKASRAGSCKQDGGPFKIKAFQAIEQGNCRAVLSQLHKGPLAVGIAGYGLQYYGSGVFSTCGSNLDHAVIIVGFRSGTGWRIKNSWGRQWGEEGYGWIAEGNTCGICNMAFTVEA